MSFMNYGAPARPPFSVDGSSPAERVIFSLRRNDPLRQMIDIIREYNDRRADERVGEVAKTQGLFEARDRATTAFDVAEATAADPHNDRHNFTPEVIAELKADKDKANAKIEADSREVQARIRVRNEGISVENAVFAVIGTFSQNGEVQSPPTPSFPSKVGTVALERGTSVQGRAARERKAKNWLFGPDADFAAAVRNMDSRAAGFEARPGGEIVVPTTVLPGVGTTGRPTNRPTVTDVEALLYRYHREAILADLKKSLDEFYSTVPSDLIGTAEEQRKQIRKLNAEILEAEKREAGAIWASLRSGDDSVFFRADMDAKIILGLA